MRLIKCACNKSGARDARSPPGRWRQNVQCMHVCECACLPCLSMQCHAHTFFMLTACMCIICRSASKGFSTSTASRCEPTVARDCLQRPGPCIRIYIGYVKPLDSCIHAFFMRECMHPSALSLAWAGCGRRHRECPNAQDLQCRHIRVRPRI